MFKHFAILAILAFLNLDAGLIADYDSRCDSMHCHHAQIDPALYPEQTGYFSKETPKIIHQIWFGNRSRLDKARTGSWERFARQFNYEYKLWSEEDDDEVKSFMSSKNYELMRLLRKNSGYWAASDILRYELIKHFGGVYVDCDFSPPANFDGFVDLQQIIDFHGLTLMIEKGAREIGESAIFVANGFIICPPDHPMICSMTEQVSDNAMHWYLKQRNFDAMLVTGPFLLNKVLSGCCKVVSDKYLKKFHIIE